MISEEEHFRHIMEFLSGLLAEHGDTDRHIRYVQGYTEILAREYGRLHPRAGMTGQRLSWIVKAAGLHDIGKLAVPVRLSERDMCLSENDLRLIRDHTVRGSEMIPQLFDFMGKDFCRICRNVCLYHHERYDGSGFPKGYKREHIPVEAQLVGLADMYDVLLHGPRGRTSYSREMVYYMLMNGKCGNLSPVMCECLENAREAMETFRLAEDGIGGANSPVSA